MISSQLETERFEAQRLSLHQTLFATRAIAKDLAEEFVVQVQSLHQLEPQVIELSVIDQAVVRCWSSYVLCFAQPEDHNSHDVFQYLRDGLSKTIDQFPFIAGELKLKKDAKEGALEVTTNAQSSVAFSYRDISKLPLATTMTFEELKQLDFPPSEMESSKLGIAPNPDVVESPTYQPVFLAQATFVRGGVFVFFAHSHQIADVAGTNSIMRSWSENVSAAAYGRKPSFCEELRDSSQIIDRRRISDGGRIHPDISESSFPLVIDNLPHVEKSDCTSLPDQEQGQNPSMIWHMSTESLERLKQVARPNAGDNAEFISTLDAVNALIWRVVCKARRLQQRNVVSSTLYFVCDVRSRLQPPIRADSACNATMKLHAAQDSTRLQGSELAMSLSSAASSIRETINDFSPARFESWVSYVKSAPSFWSLKAKERLRDGPDIIATDHSKVAAYQYHWGPLGRIERIRNPWWARSNPKPFSQITLLPRLRDGSLEILTNFDESVNRRLLADPELRQFASMQCC